MRNTWQKTTFFVHFPHSSKQATNKKTLTPPPLNMQSSSEKTRFFDVFLIYCACWEGGEHFLFLTIYCAAENEQKRCFFVGTYIRGNAPIIYLWRTNFDKSEILFSFETLSKSVIIENESWNRIGYNRFKMFRIPLDRFGSIKYDYR